MTTDQILDSLIDGLLDKQVVLATAESCTGGMIAKLLTDREGSSQWFDASVVTYSNAAKNNLLGVSKATLESHGAVSQPVVKEMVLGLLDRCDAGLGVSVSGIAGPSGGSDEKPVGTVWIAWAKPGRLIEAMRFQFDGNREQVRLAAAEAALKGLSRILEQDG